MQQVCGKWQFWGVRTLQPLNGLTKILVRMITSVTLPCKPNWIKFGLAETSCQYGDVYTLLGLFIVI